eukprot:CAMPEP_0197253570 /NCGR_PEP_ID=MMETSP1429-20130617/65630_1 /TAXON_ID=49237 /ORGANISM="Chaetoceros  sp., Strain UNC1202" /LENGTH=66 /DNA_ID=CAMNT_0042716301 /DNA_START=55 /DNA_END=252 /DNA_ORIENTATION=+
MASHIINATLYNQTIGDSRVDISTVFTSWTGIITAAVSSLVSTIASGIIIYLIFVSSKKLGSVYHR